MLSGLIDYSHLTGDSEYDQLIVDALEHQLGENKAFMPTNQTKTLGNDDQTTWGLAAMAAAEANLTKSEAGEWVDFATNVWETLVARYEAEEGQNGTCGGGLRWQIFAFNAGYDYKDAPSNSKFFLLSSRLAKFTGNATYTEWAQKSYSWAKDIGLISDTYDVYSGASALEECETLNRLQFTQVHAAYTEGAALLYNAVRLPMLCTPWHHTDKLCSRMVDRTGPTL